LQQERRVAAILRQQLAEAEARAAAAINRALLVESAAEYHRLAAKSVE
jgi:hypothetical protein